MTHRLFRFSFWATFWPLLQAVVATGLAQESPVQAAPFTVAETAPRAEQVALPRDDAFIGEDWQAIEAGTANLNVASSGTSAFGSTFALRGLSNTPYFSEPAVTVYLDDIPLGGGFTNPSELSAFSQASLLPGPQGTSVGRAGDGGTLFLDPGFEPGAELRFGAGSYGSRWSALEGSDYESVSGRTDLAAGFGERQGYVANTETGQRVDGERALDGFARQLLRLSKSIEMTVEAIGERHRDGAAPLVPLNGPLFVVNRPQDGEIYSDFTGAAVRLDAALPFGSVTSVTSATGWKLDPYRDWLVIPPPIASVLTQSERAWNEELRVSSERAAWGQWSAGAWLSRSVTEGSTDRTIGLSIPYEDSSYRDSRDEAAAFAEATLTPAPKLRVVAGLRLQAVSKDYTAGEEVPTAGLVNRLTRGDRAVLPKIEIEDDLAAGTRATASASLGARPGGFSAYTDNPRFIPFAAEHLAAFEAGLRHQTSDGRLSVSARAFDYEIMNSQIERSFTPADYFVATAPRARSLGAELEAQWRPTSDWSLRCTAGTVDARLLEFSDPVTGTSYAGRRVPYSPAYTGALTADYHPRTGIVASACLRATGTTYFTESNSAEFSQGDYAVLSVRAGYARARWRILFSAENAADRGYYSQIIPGVVSGAAGPPRILGAEFAARF